MNTTIIELLQNSHRPLLLIGAGARYAIDDVIQFAEKWDIPMETTWNAVDLVPYAHPLFVGRPGIIATRGSNWAIQDCDLLLCLGARLDQPTIAYDYEKFAPDATKIVVDIDYAEGVKLPNVIFLHQTVEEVIQDLLMVTSPPTRDDYWVRRCQEYKRHRLEGNTTSFHFLESMSVHLDEDDIIVMDCGCMTVNIFCAGFRSKRGQRFIMSSCGLGSMGAALPVAIGVAIASGKRVNVISGDGSFMQNIQELEVVRRLELNLKIWIISNDGYASIQGAEKRAFGRTASSETIPDIQQIAESFGVYVKMIYAPIDELPIPRVMFDGRGNLGDMYPYGE
jgi:acetolactate synthase-1/2/3 large subunit